MPPPTSVKSAGQAWLCCAALLALAVSAAPAYAGPVTLPASPTPTVAKAPADGLAFDLHGYYRARYVRIDNVPIGRLDDTGTLDGVAHTGRDDASTARYLHSRLRLDPTLRYGGDPAKGQTPAFALNAQIDVLDTVLFGDNARQASVPLFAENPSLTGIDGSERAAVFVRRLWVDVRVPVGLMRIGRQGSQGGLGLLFNDGNGFRNDFGDANGGSTFDRIAFATRPLTVWRALRHGDTRSTPLIVVFGHDWLVGDPLGFGSDPKASTTRLAAGPFGALTSPPCGDALDPQGAEPTRKCDPRVGQWLTALVWKDTMLRLRKKDDELTLGLVYVQRNQDFNASQMHIVDGFWRFRLGLSATGPSLETAGEVVTIQGSTKGLKLLPGGLFDETTGLSQNALEGDILNWAARIGLVDRGWDATLEVGHSGGDAQLIGGDRVFSMFPVHDDYKMGLLMYPVALAARSFNTAAGGASGALHSGGGVFNSTYLNLKGRWRTELPGAQLELVGQALAGFADTLNGGKVLGFVADYFAPRDANDPFARNQCSAFDPACFIGWELDAAIKLSWLPARLPDAEPRERYMLRWSNEFGVMGAGAALAPRLAVGADVLWTVQSRLAVVW